MDNAHRDQWHLRNLRSIHDPEGAGIGGLSACHVMACTSAHLNRVVQRAVIILLPVTGSKVKPRHRPQRSAADYRLYICPPQSPVCFYPLPARNSMFGLHPFADTYHLADQLRSVIKGNSCNAVIFRKDTFCTAACYYFQSCIIKGLADQAGIPGSISL